MKITIIKTRWMQAALVLVTAWVLMVTTMGTAANAAAYTKNVYPPNKINSTTLEGWADLSLDCAGTLGCWNYLKIERWGWYGNQHVGGNWVSNHGWNKMTAELPGGCGYYRTTVVSYNHMTGGYGGGVNVGVVGATGNGTRVYEYQKPWWSDWRYYCRR